MAAALTLRAATPADGAAVAALYAPYVRASDISFETEPPDAAAMAARIAGVLGNGLPYLVARTSDGGLAGYAYAGRFHPRAAYRFTVEPSVYVAKAAHGQGVGSALYAALLAILAEQGHAEAIALVALPNAASEALHRRHGFHRSGTYERSGFKFGRWIDVGLFQKSLGTPTAPDPLPLSASATWRALG